MNNTRYFLMDVAPTITTCIEFDHKPRKARLFASGAGLEFYVRQPTVKIVDKLANIVMNKTIELTGSTRGVTLVRTAPRENKANPDQRKMF